MKSKWLKIAVAILALAAIAFAYTAIRAQKKLVTLDVRDMEVREVVRKIERQTWEDIFVHKDVSGKVTLSVNDMPIEGVLEIISEQTSSRWTALYPLYSTKQSLTSLKRTIMGETSATESGWKQLQLNRFSPGMFGASSRSENNLVTLSLINKEVDVVAAAISRFSRAHVVPEDNTAGIVSLKLADATVPEAVEQLADKAERDWTKLYVLQASRFGFGSRGPRDENRDRSTNAPGTNDGPWRSRSPEEIEEARKRFEEQLATMTPEERQRAEEMRRRMEEMRNMTPEQRRERMGEMAARPEFQQRMQDRMMGNIQNTTPEQRVNRDQRIQEMRNRRGR